MAYIVTLLIAFAMIIIALNSLVKRKKIKRKGIATVGVIFELLSDQNDSLRFRYPVIRFMTMKGEWITHSSNTGFSFGSYKKGQEVKIVYEETNPNNFIIDKSTSEEIIPLIFLICGILLIFFCTYKLVSIEF